MNNFTPRKKQHCGFTLLEILIALAIIGILAALAIPAYQNYVTRSRVVEAFVFADAERIKIIEKRLESSNNTPAAFSEPTVHMTSLQWVPVANKTLVGDSVIGYILPTMDLPGLGLRDAFALEYFYNGSWRCINADNAVGRSAVSVNQALEDKYLPASCHAGAGLMSAHPKAPLGCPPNTQKVQVKDANGKQQQVCQPSIPVVPPTVQPSVQAVIQPVKPSAQMTVNPPACPVGQDCSHKDSKCPAGQEFIGPTTVTVRDQHNPFSSGNIYTTASKSMPAQCVAKCKDSFTFNPNEPSRCTLKPSSNNHTCRGPKFICERSHVTSGPACTADAPYAANFVENLKDGSRYVTRGCISQQEAFEADKHNKAHPLCKTYNVVILKDAHFKCTFPCYGDACNLETVPDNLATWGDGKVATDLPDQFDKP